MDESSYPQGAYNDLDAPFNAPVVLDREFEITCSQSLSKTVNILTNNYNIRVYGKEEVEDTSLTNWEDEYHENDHYTPLQLIALFKRYLENDLNRMGEVKNEKRIKHLIEECEEWAEDETEYLED